jgi:hypothetical protein
MAVNLGSTPSKYSRTGLTVIKRLCVQGRILCAGKPFPNRNKCMGCSAEEITQFKDRRTRQFHPIAEAHMGHHPVSGVEFWNTRGRRSGPSTPFVRAWMLDANNYDLELGKDFTTEQGKIIAGNCSRGGGYDKSGNRHTYKAPYRNRK